MTRQPSTGAVCGRDNDIGRDRAATDRAATAVGHDGSAPVAAQSVELRVDLAVRDCTASTRRCGGSWPATTGRGWRRFARLHAWMTCQFAAIDVPAYRRLSPKARLAVPMVRPLVLPADRQAVLRQGVLRSGALLARPDRDRRQRGRRVVRIVRPAVQLGPQPARAAYRAQEPGRIHDAGLPVPAPLRHQRLLDGRLGDRHQHRHRDGPHRDGEEHRSGPRQDHRHPAPLRPGFDYVDHRVPAVPQAPARPDGRRGLRLGSSTGCPHWSAARA